MREGGAAAGAGPRDRERGASLIDVLLVLVLAAVAASLIAPVSASVADATRARHAAGFVSARLRLARAEAINRRANVGLVFDLTAGQWAVRICRDGTNNGLRRAEITSGADPCFDGPHRFSDLFPGVEIAVDPRFPGPAGEAGSSDPVRFGSSDMASFSPAGSCTAGTLFLRSGRDQHYAIRIAGVNGRTRTFRFDEGAWRWLEL